LARKVHLSHSHSRKDGAPSEKALFSANAAHLPVTDREQNKVNLAIRRGLSRCREATAPIVALAMFLEELRCDPAWNREDIRLVEAGIRHVLARVVHRDRSRSDSIK
jgi:hypothetical protein